MPGEAEGSSHSHCTLDSRDAASSPLRKTFAQVLLETKPRQQVLVQAKSPGFTDQGEPAVFFSDEEIQASCVHLQFAVIARCSYGRPPIPEIKSSLSKQLHLRSDFIISRLNARHLLIRLSCEEDFRHFLIQKSSQVKGFLFRFFRWSKDFDYDTDPSTIPVWVGFPQLPANFYHDSMLQSIAGNLGFVLRIHDATSAMTDTAEALVCVEIDLDKPRMERIWIGSEGGGFWQRINYHKIPYLCPQCHKIGHKEDQCRRKYRRRSKQNVQLPSRESAPVPRAPAQIYRPRKIDTPDTKTMDTGFNRYVPLSAVPEVIEEEELERSFDNLAPGDKGKGKIMLDSIPVSDGDTPLSVCVKDITNSSSDDFYMPSPDITRNQEMISGQVDTVIHLDKASNVSLLSHRENSRMLCQNSTYNIETQASKDSDLSVHPCILFNDARLTRARAKELAAHSSTNFDND